MYPTLGVRVPAVARLFWDKDLWSNMYRLLNRCTFSLFISMLSMVSSSQAQQSELRASLDLAPIPLFIANPTPNPSLAAQAAPTRIHNGPWVRSHRTVALTSEALRRLGSTAVMEQGEFVMELPSIGAVIAALTLRAQDERNLRGSSSHIWTGKLKQAPDSDITLVVKNRLIAGSIRRGHMIYELKPAADGQHDLIEVDADALPSDHHPVFVPREELQAADSATGSPAPPSSPATAADAGTSIDVLAVYTTSAKNANGGQDGIESLINLGIALANQALTNSQVATQFRLVHTAEVPYTESGSSNTDLSRLQLISDGFMDEVHGWRDTYKADLVTLVEDDLGGVCGIGYVMHPVSASFARYAFSVTMDSCISGYTMAHEMGHNLGSEHDREEGGTGAYPYSFGHKEAGKFRTIMAYPCTPACTRINHYSNPLVLYQNAWPTGIDDAVDPSRSADNARGFTNVLTTVANFRNSADTTAPQAPQNLRIIGP